MENDFEILEYEQPSQSPMSQNPESFLGTLGRGAARSVARGAESVLGLPGDIASIGKGNNPLNQAYDALKGYLKQAGAPEAIANNLDLLLPGGATNRAISNLPTSQELREKVTQPLTGQALEPQGDVEKLLDDIVSDAATLLVPLPVAAKVPFKSAALRSLGSAAAGNIAKRAAEEVSDSPLLGTAAKIGGMALASTYGGRQKVQGLQKKSYEDAYNNLPKNASIDMGDVKSKITKAINKYQRGDHPDKDFIVGRLNATSNLINKNGKANIRQAIELKQDWNKYLSDPSVSKESRDIIKQGVGTLNDAIARYGAKNKNFFTPYKTGEELTAALNSTNFVQKLLNKHPYLQESAKNPLVKGFLFASPYGLGYRLGGLPGIATAGLATKGLNEGARMYQLLSKSPTALNYYKDLVDASLRNDLKAVAKDIGKLDKLADKFMKDNPDIDIEEEGEWEILQ